MQGPGVEQMCLGPLPALTTLLPLLPPPPRAFGLACYDQQGLTSEAFFESRVLYWGGFALDLACEPVVSASTCLLS